MAESFRARSGIKRKRVDVYIDAIRVGDGPDGSPVYRYQVCRYEDMGQEAGIFSDAHKTRFWLQIANNNENHPCYYHLVDPPRIIKSREEDRAAQKDEDIDLSDFTGLFRRPGRGS